MLCQDRYHLALTTASDIAAKCYQAGIDLLLSLWPGAAKELDSAIAADPEFALAYAARARLHAIQAELNEARIKISKASELAILKGTERERSHVMVLSLAINGQAAKALQAALAHIDHWPQDILIMSLPLGAFGLFAFSGMADHDQARVDLCDRYARHFESDDWWFLTYRGWAHGENGNLKLGRELTERSLSIRLNNANGVHALSHVMYESGSGKEASELIKEWLPDYDRSGILHGHIAWHWALAELERGNADQALTVYSQYVAPPVSAGVPLNVISDAASFLWRLKVYGHNVPEGLWNEATTYSSGYFQQPGFPFADVHMAMLATATGKNELVEQRIKALSEMVEDDVLPAGRVVPTICQAIRSFAEEDYKGCMELLEPVAGEVVRIGGSSAQRDIFEDTLLVALIRNGETLKAQTLVDHRLHRRPSSRDAAWRGLLV
ncbi:tetratricopeptide repeat protein [Vreelandella boliviensis]|uniref:tetratricopeptide repeat protein n=1 Tax=Vreelandella boliviensis TaxID=223527 RepID=UPI001B8CAFC7|nr:tetratricopeptide repeat protein [Halomonas boliviensis]MBS3669998.1 tetratricopeptide repeat protein [Halomonas boliviensis]